MVELSSYYGSLERQSQSQSQSRRSADGRDRDGKTTNGLTVLGATLFIAGEMAGSGVLALPRAVVNTGYIGMVLLVYFCFNAAYGGIKLGDCWNIVERKYPEHGRKNARNPYAIIGQKAAGNAGSFLVSNCIRVTLFGAGTVYLLLASQMIKELAKNALPGLSSCTVFLVLAICLIPPAWLTSPKEFSFVGFGAVATTLVACLLYLVQIGVDLSNRTDETVERRVHGFHDFFTSFGTLLFAYGGASTFPTIQNDMEDKKAFSKSVTYAFIIIGLLYAPITIGGFLAYGEAADPNITLSLTDSKLVAAGDALMACHLVFAFLISLNPVCQDVEEALGIPERFNWKRCALRSLTIASMIAAGESVPQFGLVLSLVGGSTVTMTTFVFPPLFYMRLSDRAIPLHERVYMWQLIFVGVVGGGASTFSAVSSIFGLHTFVRPCFLQ